jgi:hypothetical protein
MALGSKVFNPFGLDRSRVLGQLALESSYGVYRRTLYLLGSRWRTLCLRRRCGICRCTLGLRRGREISRSTKPSDVLQLAQWSNLPIDCLLQIADVPECSVIGGGAAVNSPGGQVKKNTLHARDIVLIVHLSFELVKVHRHLIVCHRRIKSQNVYHGRVDMYKEALIKSVLLLDM